MQNLVDWAKEHLDVDYYDLMPCDKLTLAEAYAHVAHAALSKEFKLHYVLEDCGDGSSAIRWFEDEAKAESFIENYEYDIIPECVESETFTIVGEELRPSWGFHE